MNPPGPMTGNSPAAFWLNRLRDFCIANRLVSGPGYRLKRNSSGVGLELDSQPGGGSGSPLAYYKFVTMNDDDMDCHTWNDDTKVEGKTIIKVTKPPLLKGSMVHRVAGSVAIDYANWNPATQSRTATTKNGPIVQFITPLYVSGDIIVASQIGKQLVDQNIDGRVFAGPSQ